MAGALWIGGRRGKLSAWLPLLVASLITICSGLVLFKVYALQAERRHEAARAELLSRLSVLRAHLEYNLTAPLLISRGLVAQIILHDGLTDAEFARAASLVIKDYDSVRNLTMSRGTVISAVYPEAPNRAVLGVDYHSKPDQWPSVERAISSRKPVVAGPVNLIQGGTALIGRVPVYMPDHGGGESRFFGLISVVIDLPKVFSASGLDAGMMSMELAVRGHDGLGRLGDMIRGDESIFGRSPVEMEVSLPDGTWIMAAIPKGGWAADDGQLRVTGGMGAVLFLLTVLASFGWAFYARRQQRASRLVAESEQRYRALMETVPVAVVVHREGIILFANTQAARTVRMAAGETLVGRKVMDFVLPEDRQSVAERVATVLAKPDQEAGGPVRYVTCDGQVIETEVVSIRVGLEDQPAVLSVVLDVSLRKKAERERESLLDSLRRSNEDLQQFAYIASHDLQEPLRNVSGYVQLLGRRYRGRLDKDADDFISFAVEGTKRMQEMIANLLDYSRLQHDDGVTERVDSRLPLDEALADLGAAIDESGAVVEVVGHMPVVFARRVELARIFLNLIGNAIKYRRSDTVTLIRISARREGTNWVICVADNGIGMEPAYLDRIFTLFQRLHSRDTYDGTGIGLAICRKLVQHNGGRIWAESELGRGSTFNFSLQAAD
ncbi:Phytochrome two-component sensor histidine kinase Cyanobacterial phytochrome B [Paramagnetospirillum magnetotacticum MS-1]|uniref:histidine kinase n=1 Tax=Paramagnetospirillum magnetotacticum MS-1 TaxID=272627 RepID=A0A0C2YUF7_PARME|nr:ATP-binding protein [Paramagnetospirillum magnetotacticum]KIL98758.1 Phytochrome two-component sensor histidine kinase Cyanobacterial phytochrome B [Paramagnetospirillum magnetotacticum MS-1]